MKQTTILYDKIGTGYNNTRQPDPYISEKLFQLLSPQTNKVYLDIGCGTGNYTIQFADKGFDFSGVDPSDQMLQEARTKSNKINWVIGSAEQIPSDNETFDGAVATLTVHHWTNLEKSFRELFRVMKVGSKIIFFTATPEQMNGYWLNHYFPQMLKLSIDHMPSFESIKFAANKAGFNITVTEKYFIQEDLQDLFLYSGKHKPEIYFDTIVRKGISSFAALAVKDEVASGLSQLQKDIETKRFDKIKTDFENNFGDYLFIVAEK